MSSYSGIKLKKRTNLRLLFKLIIIFSCDFATSHQLTPEVIQLFFRIICAIYSVLSILVYVFGRKPLEVTRFELGRIDNHPFT